MTFTIIIKDGTFKKMLVRKEGEENILFWSCHSEGSDF